ncbi:MAG: hypothetical protein IK127_04580 [Clostridia bacterium]|nr:hypothetical protein [Clostridia bacterium]
MRSLDLSWMNKKGNDVGIGVKINRVEEQIINSNPLIRGKLNETFITDLKTWVGIRHNLVHQIAYRIYDTDEVKQCALEGAEIIRQLSNAAARVKRAAKKTMLS